MRHNFDFNVIGMIEIKTYYVNNQVHAVKEMYKTN
jgi:hypothetical protein